MVNVSDGSHENKEISSTCFQSEHIVAFLSPYLKNISKVFYPSKYNIKVVYIPDQARTETQFQDDIMHANHVDSAQLRKCQAQWQTAVILAHTLRRQDELSDFPSRRLEGEIYHMKWRPV